MSNVSSYNRLLYTADVVTRLGTLLFCLYALSLLCFNFLVVTYGKPA